MKKTISLVLMSSILIVLGGCNFTQNNNTETEPTDDSIVDEIDAGLGSKVETTGSIQVD